MSFSDEMRARHPQYCEHDDECCARCGESWPCDAVRAADEIDAAQSTCDKWMALAEAHETNALKWHGEAMDAKSELAAVEAARGDDPNRIAYLEAEVAAARRDVWDEGWKARAAWEQTPTASGFNPYVQRGDAADEIDRLNALVKGVATHADAEARRAMRAEAAIARVRELCSPETAAPSEAAIYKALVLRALDGRPCE